MTDYNCWNGWSNKETWLANRWLSKYLQQEVGDGEEISAAHIKDTINNMLEDSPDLWGLFSDLLDTAINKIDCHEIARHYNKEL